MTETKKPLNILYIDDEEDNLNGFVFNCEQFWETQTMLSPKDVMDPLYKVEQHDAIIIDLVFDAYAGVNLRGKIDASEGLQLLDWLQTKHPEMPVMVLSAYLTDDLRATIKKKYPNVLCKDKPLNYSGDEFQRRMEEFVAAYRAAYTTD